MIAFPRRIVPLAAAAWLAVGVQACSLNPQPLPPGDQQGGPDGSGGELASDATTSAEGGSQLGPDDAGAGADVALPGTPGEDGGADGGFNGAADGATDSPSDAAVEGSSDGSTE